MRNVVWITADVHYAAAHEYHPSRARFTSFDPFWEFVAGPLHAGTFGPRALDPTFGPDVKFCAVPDGMKPNRPPSDGLQFFGALAFDPATHAATVTLHDRDRPSPLHAGAGRSAGVTLERTTDYGLQAAGQERLVDSYSLFPDP